MALYTIGDLHLCLSVNKPMDIFGNKWVGYVEKLKSGFADLTDEDVTVICGDISWGMTLEECREDFKFIDSLPGKKIILKGNHDYWWNTANKIRHFFSENSIKSISILNNNSYVYDGMAICGSRGWFYEEEKGAEHDKKILNREVLRLRASLDSAGDQEKIVFLHYPPICQGYRCEQILEVLKEYNVRQCYYGHLHSKGCLSAFNGWTGGTEFHLISADFIDFKPVQVNRY